MRADERTLWVWAEGEDDGGPRQLQTWIQAASRATCEGTRSTGRGGAQVPSYEVEVYSGRIRRESGSLSFRDQNYFERALRPSGC